MTWSDIPWRPSARMLRQFAGLWIAFFASLAYLNGVLRGNADLALVFAALVVAVGPLGLVWPRAIRPVFVGWMILAFPIGWTVSHLVMAVLYYGVFTPVGLCCRLWGRDVLGRRYPPDQATYWMPITPTTGSGSYFRQF
jgi:Saxitoxin biosynthesis operon protein SxtJ